MSADKHKGYHLSVWISDEAAERLDELCAMSGRTKTKVVNALILDKPVPERSFARTVAYIAKLGGLLKHSIELGQSERVYQLGEQILKIARSLK